MALSLSRKKRQSLLIGNNITVTIADVCGDRVTLQVDAPKDVTVLRDEIAPYYPRQTIWQRMLGRLFHG